MRTYRIYQRCALALASFVLAFILLAGSSFAENWPVLNNHQGGNRNITYTIDMDVIPGYKDTSRYLVGLHSRMNAFHSKSVLISGILLAPAGTEIVNAGVQVGDRWFPAAEVCRFFSQNIPESELKDMEVEVDKTRSAFAFLVDLSEANLQDGYMIKMEVSGVTLMFSDYALTLDDNCWPYSDVEHALDGYIVKYGESGEGVNILQRNLAAKKYLEENQLSGIYDEATRLAVKDFCKVNGLSETEIEKSERGVTQAVFLLSSDAQADAKPGLGLKDVLDVMNREIFSIGEFSIELWLIVAAGALLIAVILVLVLIHTRRKKRIKPVPTADEQPIVNSDLSSGNMIEIDDPTVDLEKEAGGNGKIVSELDDATEELSIFSITLRLFYNGMYADHSVQLKEGESVVIGRSSEAKIQTNPDDKSVSSKHGLFSVKNGTVIYTDQSTNGTKVGESLYLGKNKDAQTFDLPLNTRVTMELGVHKVWVLVRQLV